ncbi:hypothetical protein EDD21DRAFT_306498 [Dissophora ornata]|nr:hypothetical protein EDD21DRAFT_306498 [Dissophora ornata]
MEACSKGQGIKWHDATAEGPQRYLGYPMVCAAHQFTAFYDQLTTKIQHAVNIYSQRILSVMGKTLTTNALVLSKLWNVCRIHPPTKRWMKNTTSIVRKFLMPFFLRACRPREG